MHPLILIGFDLVFSAVLILLVLHLTWGRLRKVLEAQGMALAEPVREPASERTDRAEQAEAVEHGDSLQIGNMTSQAESLRKQGLSVEDIASRLQSPRGEIEMILALSEMGKTAGPQDPGPVVPPPKRKITELLRF